MDKQTKEMMQSLFWQYHQNSLCDKVAIAVQQELSEKHEIEIDFFQARRLMSEVRYQNEEDFKYLDFTPVDQIAKQLFPCA